MSSTLLGLPDYKSSLNAFPGTNLTVLLLLILIFSPVFGLTPVRAFRVAILTEVIQFGGVSKPRKTLAI